MMNRKFKKVLSRAICACAISASTVTGFNANIVKILLKSMRTPGQHGYVIGQQGEGHLRIIPNGVKGKYTDADKDGMKHDVETLAEIWFNNMGFKPDAEDVKKEEYENDFIENSLGRDTEGKFLSYERSKPRIQYKICDEQNKTVGFLEARLVGIVKNYDLIGTQCMIKAFVDREHQGAGVQKEAIKKFIRFCEGNKENGEILRYFFSVNDENRPDVAMVQGIFEDLGEGFSLQDSEVMSTSGELFHRYTIEKIQDPDDNEI